MSKFKKVLIVGPSTKGLKGGQATHMENIERVFSTVERVELSYFFSSSGLENTENPVLKFLRLIQTIISFPFYLSSNEVVHINSSFDNKAIIRDYFILFWCACFNKQTIIQYHGGSPFQTSLLRFYLIRYLFEFMWKRSQVLVLNSDQERWFLQYKSIKSTTVKNYVSLPVPERLLIKEKFKFVYLGRIIKEKGLLEIVDAAKSLCGRFDFEVDIYGDGEDFELINRYIESKKITNCVSLKGSVSLNDKPAVLKGADFFLYPSYYPEGLPYAVLEALSYSLPVICTNAGALKHVVTHLVTGLKVKDKSSTHLAELMQLLMSDANMHSKLSCNARSLIEEHYSVDVMRVKFMELWNA